MQSQQTVWLIFYNIIKIFVIIILFFLIETVNNVDISDIVYAYCYEKSDNWNKTTVINLQSILFYKLNLFLWLQYWNPVLYLFKDLWKRKMGKNRSHFFSFLCLINKC